MRKGLIKITNEIYQNDYALVSEIFKRFRPTHIEFRHWENDMWYLWGVSDSFEIVKEAQEVPVYDVTFTKDKYNNYTYEFHKS